MLLEATDEWGGTTLDVMSFGRLLQAWGAAKPATLYSPSRYALHVPVEARDAPSALASAMSLWKDAVRCSALPQWNLVRAEVVTAEEFEKELQAAEHASRRHDLTRTAGSGHLHRARGPRHPGGRNRRRHT